MPPPATFQPTYDQNYGSSSAFHKPEEIPTYGASNNSVTQQDSQTNAFNNQPVTPMAQQSPTAYPAAQVSQPPAIPQQQPPAAVQPQPTAPSGGPAAGYPIHQPAMPPPQVPSYQSYYPPQAPAASNYPPPPQHAGYHNYPPAGPYNQPYGQELQYGGYHPPPPPPPHGNYNYPPYNPHPGQWQ